MSKISEKFSETFFESKHLHKQTFDNFVEKIVNSFLQQPSDIGKHDMENFQDFFSSEELNDALKQSPSSTSFDPELRTLK